MATEWTLETLKAHYDALREADKQAVTAAFEAAKEKSLAHNDLIREMQRKESAYITKAAAYLALVGVVGVVSATVATLAFFLK